jgi:hypothetical protein
MRTLLVLFLALAPVAFAAESASYSLTPLALDAGGRATSASYTLDSSTSPGGAAASASYAARTGFSGSLYDAVGLDLTASPLTVNESATRQLGAALLFDDSSRLPLAPTAVAWSVQSGPLLSISAGGLATAGIVYQNTDAIAHGSHGAWTDTLTLSVLNVGADDFGSYAGDGLGDDWQVQFFGENNPLAAPGVDASGNGHTNLFKFIAGLHPLDPADRFVLTLAGVPGQPAQRAITFSPRLPDRAYAVKAKPALTAPTWNDITASAPSDNGTERTVIDLDATGGAKFYRVEITKP